LNLKIRHPPYTATSQTGNTDIDPTTFDSAAAASASVTVDPSTCPSSELSPLRNIISINGEPIEASSLWKINIHDNATFVNEAILSEGFIGNLKRRSIDGGLGRGDNVVSPSVLRFRGAVQSLVKSDAVMKMMKHFSHRSESGSDSDAEDESPLPVVPTSPAAAGLNAAATATSDVTPVTITQATIEDPNTNNNNNNGSNRSQRSVFSDPTQVVIAVPSLQLSSPPMTSSGVVGNIRVENRAAAGADPSPSHIGSTPSPKSSTIPPGSYEVSSNPPHPVNGNEVRVEKAQVNLDNTAPTPTAIASPVETATAEKEKVPSAAASNKTTTVSTTAQSSGHSSGRRMKCDGCCDIQ